MKRQTDANSPPFYHFPLFFLLIIKIAWGIHCIFREAVHRLLLRSSMSEAPMVIMELQRQEHQDIFSVHTRGLIAYLSITTWDCREEKSKTCRQKWSLDFPFKIPSEKKRGDHFTRPKHLDITHTVAAVIHLWTLPGNLFCSFSWTFKILRAGKGVVVRINELVHREFYFLEIISHVSKYLHFC